MDKISCLFRYKILPVYWAFLTYMLLMPSDADRQKLWFEFDNLDKVIHLCTFIVLGFCYCMAFPKHSKKLFIAVMFIYALLTEIFQELMDMGRTMDIYDLLADMAGVIFGYFIWKKSLFFLNK